MVLGKLPGEKKKTQLSVFKRVFGEVSNIHGSHGDWGCRVQG